MQINDTISLDASGLKITKDGYLIGDAKVSRAGNVQQYLGIELGLTGDDSGKAFGVYRDPEVVFDRESMMSLAGRPVTRGHPASPVTSDNWKDLAVGQVGGVIRRDGDHVVAPMAIMDAAAAQEVASGARSLSAGYTVDVVASEGVASDGTPYQFKQAGKLRFNHVAYLPDNNPRAGNTRIGDNCSDSQQGEKPESKGGHMPDMKTVVLGDTAVQVALADAQAIEQFKRDSAQALKDAEAKQAAVLAEKDEQIGKLKADLVKAQDAANIDVDALVAARTDLLGKIKATDASIETAGKSDAELRKAAVASKLGDAMVKDASDAEINGMFKAIATTAGTNSQVADAFKSGLKPIGDASTAMNDAQSAYVARLTRQNKE